MSNASVETIAIMWRNDVISSLVKGASQGLAASASAVSAPPIAATTLIDMLKTRCSSGSGASFTDAALRTDAASRTDAALRMYATSMPRYSAIEMMGM